MFPRLTPTIGEKLSKRQSIEIGYNLRGADSCISCDYSFGAGTKTYELSLVRNWRGWRTQLRFSELRAMPV
jgi:hypothetical protein